MRYRQTIAYLAVVGLTACQPATEIDRFRSPDKKYTVVVYREPLLVAMPGQASDASGYADIQDQQGNQLCRLIIPTIGNFYREILVWGDRSVRMNRIVEGSNRCEWES